jgi:hypothetical protein
VGWGMLNVYYDYIYAVLRKLSKVGECYRHIFYVDKFCKITMSEIILQDSKIAN